MEKVRVGVVGCGKISGAYLGMAKNFPLVEIAACSDLNLSVAREQGEKYQIPKICTVDELMRDPSIEIILNLTIPKAHHPIAMQAIAHGKHTYAEKPLAVTRDEGEEMLAAARQKGVLIGCAPDTFMGAGIQTARKCVDEGMIGRPVAFSAAFMTMGHESWHPSPEFYYQPGGGPMMDMGPYYLTALLNILGPAKRVMGMASYAIPERIITSEPKKGSKITVETPDHILGLMEFENGCSGTLVTTFAAAATHDRKQPITLWGTEGVLRVPDPNNFDLPVSFRARGSDEWTEVPLSFVTGYGRSVGLADMAHALRSGRAIRASGEQALVVLDLMQGFIDASSTGREHRPSLPYQRPAPMRADLPFGTLEA